MFGRMLVMKKLHVMSIAVGLALSLQAAQVYSVPEDERIYPGYEVEGDLGMRRLADLILSGLLDRQL